MPMFCSNCGRQVREDMRFCPDCGEDVTFLTGMDPVPRQTGPPVRQDQTYPQGPPFIQGPQFPQGPPFPGGYAMGPYPFPMYYRPPVSGMRVMAVAGGILMIIDACLAVLLALLLMVEVDLFALGLFMFGTSVISFLASVWVFLSFKPIYTLLGPVLLITGGALLWIVEPQAFIVSAIGMTIAGISLLLLVASWRDSTARFQARSSGLHPSMAGLMPGGMMGPPPGYGGAEPPSLLNLRK